jgi:Pyridoxamine 5'-phosphate oxidase
MLRDVATTSPSWDGRTAWRVFAGQSGAWRAGRGRVTQPSQAGILNSTRSAPIVFKECVVAISQQRRGRSIAMTPAELDEFLAQAHTCRVATLAPDGPHVVPLWFAWAAGALWLSSLVRSQRWADLIRDPRVAVVVDAGQEYQELRGAEIKGTAEPVGEVPRRGTDDPQLAATELLFARKYLGGDTMVHDGRHGWLRVTPVKITSWDFRKLPPDRAQLAR